MDWSDYEVDGQLSIFDLIDEKPVKGEFNPIEEFAKIVHITNRHNRIADYFIKNSNIKDRVAFLKKEYANGGGYSRSNKAYEIVSYNSDSNLHYVDWNMCENGNLHRVTSQFSYETLAKTIDLMIKQGRYIKNETR